MNVKNDGCHKLLENKKIQFLDIIISNNSIHIALNRNCLKTYNTNQYILGIQIQANYTFVLKYPNYAYTTI